MNNIICKNKKFKKKEKKLRETIISKDYNSFVVDLVNLLDKREVQRVLRLNDIPIPNQNGVETDMMRKLLCASYGVRDTVSGLYSFIPGDIRYESPTGNVIDIEEMSSNNDEKSCCSNDCKDSEYENDSEDENESTTNVNDKKSNLSYDEESSNSAVLGTCDSRNSGKCNSVLSNSTNAISSSRKLFQISNLIGKLSASSQKTVSFMFTAQKDRGYLVLSDFDNDFVKNVLGDDFDLVKEYFLPSVESIANLKDEIKYNDDIYNQLHQNIQSYLFQVMHSQNTDAVFIFDLKKDSDFDRIVGDSNDAKSMELLKVEFGFVPAVRPSKKSKTAMDICSASLAASPVTTTTSTMSTPSTVDSNVSSMTNSSSGTASACAVRSICNNVEKEGKRQRLEPVGFGGNSNSLSTNKTVSGEIIFNCTRILKVGLVRKVLIQVIPKSGKREVWLFKPDPFTVGFASVDEYDLNRQFKSMISLRVTNRADPVGSDNLKVGKTNYPMQDFVIVYTLPGTVKDKEITENVRQFITEYWKTIVNSKNLGYYITERFEVNHMSKEVNNEDSSVTEDDFDIISMDDYPPKNRKAYYAKMNMKQGAYAKKSCGYLPCLKVPTLKFNFNCKAHNFMTNQQMVSFYVHECMGDKTNVPKEHKAFFGEVDFDMNYDDDDN